jgi:hypothetical protein
MEFDFGNKTEAVAALLHAGFSYAQIGEICGIAKPSSYGSRARKLIPQKLTADEMSALIAKVGEPAGQETQARGRFKFEV